jgi:hypothetical protein
VIDIKRKADTHGKFDEERSGKVINNISRLFELAKVRALTGQEGGTAGQGNLSAPLYLNDVTEHEGGDLSF